MAHILSHDPALMLSFHNESNSFHIEDANDAALQLLGYDRETLRKMEPSSLFTHEKDWKKIHTLFHDYGNLFLDKVSMKASEAPLQLDLTAESFQLGSYRVLNLRINKPVLTRKILNRIEMELLQTSTLLHSILNNTHMHIACMDSDFNFITVNEQYARAANKTPEYFIGKNHFDLYPHQENEAIFRNVVETGEPFLIYEKPFIHPDSPEKGPGYWDWSLIPVKDENNEVTQVVLTLADVTEKVVSRETIRKNEELFRRSMEVGRIFAFEWNVTTEEITRTGECGSILGIGNELANHDTATRFLSMLSEKDREKLNKIIRELTPRDDSYHVVYSFVNPNDLKVVLEETGKGMFDNEGNLTSIVGIAVDITRRRKTEEALVNSEAEIRKQLIEIENIYKIAPIGMCMFDRDLRYIRVNDQLAKINGLPAHEHLGRTPAEVVPDLANQAESILRRVIESGEPVLNQVIKGETPANPGITRTWNESWFPLYDENDEIYGVGTIIEDITEKLYAEEQLRDLNETLEQRIEKRTGKIMQLANQLRAMNIELNRVEQRERIRLAQMLHDHIQQYLISARIQIGWIKRKSSESTIRERSGEIISILNKVIESTRSLTVEIHPPVLSVSGLSESLYWLADYMYEKFGFRVAVDADEQAEPDSEEARYLLFECVRELLLNSLKHSGTKRAGVKMTLLDENFIRIQVEDRGKGFNTELLNYHSAGFTSFGLFNIQQRLTHFEGSMDIQSNLSEGTSVTLIMPARHEKISPADTNRKKSGESSHVSM
ncbi:MAG: PAS domain-containing sensor histidine kinase [Spirochaetota bacterium]